MSKKRKPPVYRAILAMDPGAAAGIALYVEGALVGSRACDGSKASTLRAAIEDIVQPVFDQEIPPEERLCIIEDGFGRGIGAKTLDRRRGLCMAAAEACGFHVVKFISPSTWHAAMLKARDSDAMKKEAIWWCQTQLGLQPTDNNEADAACLGWYATHSS